MSRVSLIVGKPTIFGEGSQLFPHHPFGGGMHRNW